MAEVKTMARKKKSRRKGFNTQTIMKLVRMGALLGPAAFVAIQPNRSAASKAGEIIANYTGFNANTNQFDASLLAKGWLPYLASVGITYGIPKLAGIIRSV